MGYNQIVRFYLILFIIIIITIIIYIIIFCSKGDLLFPIHLV